MTINFQSAINAYNQASNIATSPSSNEKSVISSENSFSDMIKESTKNVSNQISRAENLSMESLVNQADVTDVVTAVTDAEMTLRTVIAVRDKLIEAHQQIMQMPI